MIVFLNVKRMLDVFFGIGRGLWEDQKIKIVIIIFKMSRVVSFTVSLNKYVYAVVSITF